ncbi:MAG TPA: vanadium-dependent haloperoxidase [Segetibacter sp.]|nr:vanadium-dependent haloperoxidase [Segetibacter sp.]
MRARLTTSFCLVVLLACNIQHKKANPKLLADANLLHENMHQLTEVIILDMFSPPVSSRIYSYASLAAYEAIKFDKRDDTSLANDLNGFTAMPVPEKDKNYNYLLAATKAFFTVAEKITFSKDTLVTYQDRVYADFKTLLDKEIFDNSLQFGQQVGNAVLERTKVDNYKETRGMPKFLGSNEIGKWRPTPSDYLDALEPNWGSIMPLSLDSAAQIKCPLPPAFSMEKNSPFYKTASEVYELSKHLDEEQKTIAKYWDDNPFVIEHSGHLMFATKKITPVGHWIGITGIACKMKNLDAVETARIYALTAIAMFDVGVSCWREKYIHNVIRPVTVINDYFDRGWQAFLQTPSFPEHSSGHSGFSAAAAAVLTRRFGENFAFEDTSDLAYIGMKRTFPSFVAAAQEASISRVYGGIHYRTGIDAGAVQGRTVGALVIGKFMEGHTKPKTGIVTAK